MKELLSQFWIGVLSCIAFTGLSSWAIYSYGQEPLNSIGLGIVIGVLALTVYYMLSKKNLAAKEYPKINMTNNSQNVNAITISNSEINKINNIKINK